jgi:hypothetical protein
MSNMAIGIPIGHAIGINTGITVGKQQASKDIKNKIIGCALSRAITIKDSSGVAVMLELFTEEVCAVNELTMPTWLHKTLFVGLTLLVAAGVVTYFMVSG